MSVKPRILVARAIFSDCLVRLEKNFEVISNQSDTIFSPEQLREYLSKVDAALVAGSERIDESALVNAKNLKFVANISVG